MRNINSNGSALIGLIIVIAIVLALVFGLKFIGGEDQKSQIESGNENIQKARDAANLEYQNAIDIQNELNK